MKTLKVLLGLSISMFATMQTNAAVKHWDIADVPLLVGGEVQIPLVMLSMTKDHKMFSPAYNDVVDLDADGHVDVGFKPYLEYDGYFDPTLCYTYNSGTSTFEPSANASSSTGTFRIGYVDENKSYKKCSGSWSGNFMNYVTMTRMDVIRKVMYGGMRDYDSSSATTLRRAYVPIDGHTFGKQYQSEEIDGYKITEFTPLSQPVLGHRHLFANNSPGSSSWHREPRGTSDPLLKVVKNTKFKIHDWVMVEKPVGDTNRCTPRNASCQHGAYSGQYGPVPEEVFFQDNTIDAENGLKQQLWVEYVNTDDADTTNNSYRGITTGINDASTMDTFFNDYALHSTEADAKLFKNGSTHIKKFPEFVIKSIDQRGNIFGQTFLGNSTTQSNEAFQYWTKIEGYIDFDRLADLVSNPKFGANIKGTFEIKVDGNVIMSNYTQTSSNGVTGAPMPYVPLISNSVSDTSSNLSHTGKVKFEFRYVYVYTGSNSEHKQGGKYAFYVQHNFQNASASFYSVRVAACTSSFHTEGRCKQYPDGNWKPVGILNKFGEDDTVLFGLMSGSYVNTLEGGILRKEVSSFSNEVDPNNGRYHTSNWASNSSARANGIIYNMDRFSIYNFNEHATGGYYVTGDCPQDFDVPLMNGRCQNWGNPIAEIMYESVRYFEDKGWTNGTRTIHGSHGGSGPGGLTRDTSWSDPFDLVTASERECIRPYNIVISDVFPDHDGDLPNSKAHWFYPNGWYEGKWSDSGNPDFGSILDDISTAEGISGNYLIGENNSTQYYAPKSLAVSSLSEVRGLSPDGASKSGTFYAAAVAKYGADNDIRPDVSTTDPINIKTIAIGMDSPIPKLKINVGAIDSDPTNDEIVEVLPFGRAIHSSNACCTVNYTVPFQPTSQVTSVVIDELSDNFGRFFVSYEDAEMGIDYDMDLLVEYAYLVDRVNKTVTVSAQTLYSGGVIIMHAGMAVVGTTEDDLNPFQVVRSCGIHSYGGHGSSYMKEFCRDTDVLSLDSDKVHRDDYPRNRSSSIDMPLRFAKTFQYTAASSTKTLPNPLELAGKHGSPADDSTQGYYPITNASDLQNALETALDNIAIAEGSISISTLAVGQVSTTDLVISATFDTGDWSGALNAYAADDTSNPVWEAGSKIKTTGRNVVTYDKTNKTGIDFSYASSFNTSIPSAQLVELAKNAGYGASDVGSNAAMDTYLKELVGYIRGESDYSYRLRKTLLGDIVNGSPILVGSPSGRYPAMMESTSDVNKFYSTFKKDNNSRTPIVIVGANDGMLHIFDATDGTELLAYVPVTVYENLYRLQSTSYKGTVHKYFVDGKGSAIDVFIDEKWKTIYVGGLGAGGQGIFAIDVTDPSALSASSVLWEFNDSDDSSLGYTYSRPQISKMANGKWAVIIGNGYNNMVADDHVHSTGDASLLIIDIETGALIKKISTNWGYAQWPDSSTDQYTNGLSTPSVIDTDGDFVADYIYAGDLHGNLWKFDVTDTNSSGWTRSSTPVFQARSRENTSQPITTRPAVASGPASHIDNFMVYFGTGKFFESDDNQSTGRDTQSFYGILDDGTTSLVRNNLVQQSIDNEVSDVMIDGVASDIRLFSTNSVDYNAKKGCYLDLYYGGANNGERVIFDSSTVEDNVLFSTMYPVASGTGGCGGGSSLSGWFMMLDRYTCGNVSKGIIDSNGNKVVEGTDPVGAFKPEEGVIGAPIPSPSSPSDQLNLCLNGFGSVNCGMSVEVSESNQRQSWRFVK